MSVLEDIHEALVPEAYRAKASFIGNNQENDLTVKPAFDVEFFGDIRRARAIRLFGNHFTLVAEHQELSGFTPTLPDPEAPVVEGRTINVSSSASLAMAISRGEILVGGRIFSSFRNFSPERAVLYNQLLETREEDAKIRELILPTLAPAQRIAVLGRLEILLHRLIARIY